MLVLQSTAETVGLLVASAVLVVTRGGGKSGCVMSAGGVSVQAKKKKNGSCSEFYVPQQVWSIPRIILWHRAQFRGPVLGRFHHVWNTTFFQLATRTPKNAGTGRESIVWPVSSAKQCDMPQGCGVWLVGPKFTRYARRLIFTLERFGAKIARRACACLCFAVRIGQTERSLPDTKNLDFSLNSRRGEAA